MTAIKSILKTQVKAAKKLFDEWLRNETIDRLRWSEGEIFITISLESDSKAEVNLFNSIKIS